MAARGFCRCREERPQGMPEVSRRAAEGALWCRLSKRSHEDLQMEEPARAMVKRPAVHAWAPGSGRFGRGGALPRRSRLGPGSCCPQPGVPLIRRRGGLRSRSRTGEAVVSPRGRPAPTKTASKCGPRHMGAEATKLEHRMR
ncbi:hypothetical protein NDU88_007004 [Pleurodeles waltl]|uniref:Uncharacterized protein n=1 Tax=Pleurodeles waltl TaxID=8319 RepID=A0AAV7PQ50_PLEWA|nr:hypothetical protein NDU88_007004 [Pleurodeles waltl]